MASVEYMEDQSPNACQHSRHSSSNHHHGYLCETPTTTNAMVPLHPHQQLLLTKPRVSEKEESLSPVVPSLVHLPLCRQSPPLIGLRYRNLGKSGLRISNIGDIHIQLLFSVS
jgi:hypothetical protein